MITIQNYVRARSLEEAWQLNQNKRSRILGGMLWLRLGSATVNTAIDLCDLTQEWIDGALKSNNCRREDVFLMTVNKAKQVFILRMEEAR